MATPKLFQPVKVGDMTLQHRVVLSPLTRFRATATSHVQLPLASVYYGQHASTPGTLLISEATFIDAQAGGYANVPGIYTEEQIASWKKVTNIVHAKGSFIYLQLWALGRTADPSELASENPNFPYISASDVPLHSRPRAPRPLTVDEIHKYVELYAGAASRAVNEAGFDGVEILAGNGYLVDQFLQDVTNKRTDEYGGSIEKRTRFGLEVVDAVVKAVGGRKTSIRLSPWGQFQEMRMDDPKPTFSHFVSRLRDLHPDLAYIHVVEPRVIGSEERNASEIGEQESNNFIREIWAPRPLISAGGYTRESAIQTAETKGDLIAFGRFFLANPDLPKRLRENIPLNPYDRSTFYLHGDDTGKGYTDYPFAK